MLTVAVAISVYYQHTAPACPGLSKPPTYGSYFCCICLSINGVGPPRQVRESVCATEAMRAAPAVAGEGRSEVLHQQRILGIYDSAVVDGIFLW